MPSPRGGSSFLLCLRMLGCCSFPLGKVGMGPLCWDGACCLRRGGYYVSSPLFFASVKGDKINTKSRVVDGGYALAWTVAPTVGKRVFLLVVSTIPTVMRCMTPSATTVKKAAFGRSKSPAFAGTKTAANRRPLPKPPKAPPHALPKGRELVPTEFEDVVVLLLPPWGRLGWGLYVGMGLPWWTVRTPGNSVGVAIS